MEDLFIHKDLIYTIYREKSFSRAAQKLFISQPSLSQTVRKLEQRLGIPLFDRSCKPIRLTEAGQVYISAAEQLRQVEASFENYIQALNDVEAGALGIGSNQLLSSLVLPKCIADFTKAHPKIKLTLLDANSTTLQSELIAGNLDLVIDSHIYPAELFDKKKLATERLLLAVPRSLLPEGISEASALSYEDIINGGHLSGRRAGVSLDSFSQVPFILMNRNNDMRTQTSAIFQDAGFTPEVLLELDRLVTLYAYIENGTAASVVSDTLVRGLRGTDHSGILFFTLPGKRSHRNIYVSWKRHKFRSKAMDTFMERLPEFFA